MRTSLTRFSVWPYPLPPISSSSSDDDPVNEAFPNVLATLLVHALRRCLELGHQKFIRLLYVLMRVRSSVLSRSCCCAAACLAALPSGSQSHLPQQSHLLWQVQKYHQSTRCFSVWAYPLLYCVNDAAPMAAELKVICVRAPLSQPSSPCLARHALRSTACRVVGPPTRQRTALTLPESDFKRAFSSTRDPTVTCPMTSSGIPSAGRPSPARACARVARRCTPCRLSRR